MSSWLEELAAELRRVETTKENLLWLILSNEEEIGSFEDARAWYNSQIQAHLNAAYMLYSMEGKMVYRIAVVQKSTDKLQTDLKTTEKVISLYVYTMQQLSPTNRL
jgi:hypothetical protein